MLLAVLLLTACKQRTVYYHYEHTPLSGWEKNDTLVFTTDTIAIDGTYSEEVGIRINGTYPFLQLNLVVEHLVMPAMTVKSDTLSCRLIDETGNALGNGVSNYQYLIPLTSLTLKKGDRLRIAIRHDMKREILPGISDIGLRLRRID
jgi:gliding motility-associated lipoprotein GldH